MSVKITNGTIEPLAPEEEAELQSLQRAVQADRVPHLLNTVKAEANRRIIALIPGATPRNWIHRQLNLLMQAVWLLDKGPEAWTEEERGQITRLRALKSRIDAIRAASDQIERQIETAEDPYSVPIETNPLWPE